MIHLEITQSPDQEVIGKYEFFQNELYLGKKNGNLLINDSKLLDSHLMIEVVEKDLIVHPQKDVNSYLIDGKRSSTIRKIKVGQSITIGGTVLKVVSFEETSFRTKKEILDAKLADLVAADSSRLQVIEKLAKAMK